MKLLLVDDHELVIDGFAILLQQQLPNSIILQATNCANAQTCMENNNDIDLILLDLCIPGDDTLGFMQKVLELKNTPKIIVVTGSQNINLLYQAYNLGIKTIVLKQGCQVSITKIIQEKMNGKDYISPELKQLILAHKNDFQSVPSPKQNLVLKLMSQGLRNQEIADRLNISETTVKSHVSALLRMFDSKSRTECIRRAEKIGVLSEQTLDW